MTDKIYQRTKLGESLLSTLQGLFEEEKIDAPEAKQIAADFDEIMAEEVRSHENCRSETAKLRGKVASFNFSHMPRKKNDPTWIGQGGDMWIFNVVDAVLEVDGTRRTAIPLEGKVQLGFRHTWSDDKYRKQKLEAKLKEEEYKRRRADMRKAANQAAAGNEHNNTQAERGKGAAWKHKRTESKSKSVAPTVNSKKGFWGGRKRGRCEGSTSMGRGEGGAKRDAPAYPGSLRSNSDDQKEDGGDSNDEDADSEVEDDRKSDEDDLEDLMKDFDDVNDEPSGRHAAEDTGAATFKRTKGKHHCSQGAGGDGGSFEASSVATSSESSQDDSEPGLDKLDADSDGDLEDLMKDFDHVNDEPRARNAVEEAGAPSPKCRKATHDRGEQAGGGKGSLKAKSTVATSESSPEDSEPGSEKLDADYDNDVSERGGLFDELDDIEKLLNNIEKMEGPPSQPPQFSDKSGNGRATDGQSSASRANVSNGKATRSASSSRKRTKEMHGDSVSKVACEGKKRGSLDSVDAVGRKNRDNDDEDDDDDDDDGDGSSDYDSGLLEEGNEIFLEEFEVAIDDTNRLLEHDYLEAGTRSKAREASGEDKEKTMAVGIDEGDENYNGVQGVTTANEADALHGKMPDGTVERTVGRSQEAKKTDSAGRAAVKSQQQDVEDKTTEKGTTSEAGRRQLGEPEDAQQRDTRGDEEMVDINYSEGGEDDEDEGHEQHGDGDGGRSRDGVLSGSAVEKACESSLGNYDQDKCVRDVSAILEQEKEGDENAEAGERAEKEMGSDGSRPGTGGGTADAGRQYQEAPLATSSDDDSDDVSGDGDDDDDDHGDDDDDDDDDGDDTNDGDGGGGDDYEIQELESFADMLDDL